MPSYVPRYVGSYAPGNYLPPILLLLLILNLTGPAGFATPSPKDGQANFKASASFVRMSISKFVIMMAAVMSMMRLAIRRPGQACWPPMYANHILVSIFGSPKQVGR